ncbi:MAG: hypothetical protein KGZ87_02835 [Bacteroidetes bacterium]|nr:hypothetical protein [Bacteroidota bacterium]
MKKVSFLLLVISIFLTSCSGVKKAQNALHSGNYDQSINIALEKLKGSKNKKSNQEYIIILEEAFLKAVERDEKRLKTLQLDGNPAYSKEIFDIYNYLDRRQEKIRPLLPLWIAARGKNASFQFRDYVAESQDAKNRLTTYLYSNAITLLATNVKENARQAHRDLSELNRINPNYRNVSQLLDEAHFKGTDFVFVKLINDSHVAVPRRLEEDLLNFNSYDLGNFWTVYHTTLDKNIKYDIDMLIRFVDIKVSPEQLKERIVIKEKEVKDGFVYVYDSKGNVKKDSLGNDIKKDKYKTVRSEILEIKQFKAANVTAKVDFFDRNTNQLINSFPITSEFIFEHHFATFKGDRRALEPPYLDWINLKFVPFPSSEQMIYDTGEDLKQKIKAVIKRQKY